MIRKVLQVGGNQANQHAREQGFHFFPPHCSMESIGQDDCQQLFSKNKQKLYDQGGSMNPHLIHYETVNILNAWLQISQSLGSCTSALRAADAVVVIII